MQDHLRVVLVAPRNPLNIGAAARAMSNFGFTQMRLVNPYDVAFREARSAVKSHYILEQAQVFGSVAEAVADCALVAGTTAAERRELHMPLYRLETAAPLLRENQTAALLFGSEKFGLSNDDMSHCHWLLRIPSRPEHGSINLGQAVAICLYELRRDADMVGQQFEQPAAAPAADQERITGLLLELLDHSGFLNERTAVSTELKTRRLIRRMGLPPADAEALQGMLRHILWKMKQTDKS